MKTNLNIYKPLRFESFKLLTFSALEDNNFNIDYIIENNIDKFVIIQHCHYISEVWYYMWYNNNETKTPELLIDYHNIQNNKSSKKKKTLTIYKSKWLLQDGKIISKARPSPSPDSNKSKEETEIITDTNLYLNKINDGDIIQIKNTKFIAKQINILHILFTKITNETENTI